MIVATVSETKNRLSALIDRVRAGESVLILDRGIPVARLESAASAPDIASGRLARLERAGIVNRAASDPPEDLLSRRPPSPRDGTSALRMLLEEREQGR